MGFQFHETGYGKRFFDQQLPMLIDVIRELAAQVGRQSVLLERHIEFLEAQQPKQASIHRQAAYQLLKEEAFDEKTKLKQGDPVLVLSKPITGYEVVEATVLDNDPAAARVYVRFPDELMLKDAWIVYENIRRDPFGERQNI